ncbi:hypothetical protein [Aliikangiella sp. G2MR2-5]|uniref:hypothetical protein n=1 Tax=Aliikangiella sp. G2MR2-5 TaxID=2788943 RepID=UPI0018A8D708|nr:hypothetical protein [Aliikangiella sp. G2MR2-5]
MRQGRTGLTLREFQANQRTFVEMTPRKVSHWLQNLPVANLGESSKNIYHLLVQTNQSLLDPDKRLHILEKLCPVADLIIISLEKQFLNNHIALNEKQKKIAALVQALQTELCIGFHSVIESIVTSEIKWSNKKHLTSALAFAIKYHSFVMLRCYQLYASVPRRIWRELYILYKIARENELATNHVDIGDEDCSSCFQFFARILLLSIANPYQLRQPEIKMLWEMLPELSEHISLSSHAYNKQHFVIAVNSASPPVHKSLFSDSISNNLKLTVTPVVEHLKLKLNTLQEDGATGARKVMLIKHLIQIWSHGTHRAFARTPSNEHLEISIGLGATHYLLTQDPNIAAPGEAENTLEAMEGSLRGATLLEVSARRNADTKSDRDYLSSSGTVNEDIWAKLYRPDQAAEELKQKKQEAETRSREKIVKDSYQLQTVDLINMSPGGYCIQIAADQLPKHAQTGEILGFLEQNHWSIGVVRWVRRQAKGSQVQMGVQLLAPGAKPVRVQLKTTKKANNEFQRALRLPALTGIGQPETLITNPLAFNTKSKVAMNDTGQIFDIRLIKELTATSSFKQFQYEEIGGRKKLIEPRRRPDEPIHDTPDLDDVWDLI